MTVAFQVLRSMTSHSLGQAKRAVQARDRARKWMRSDNDLKQIEPEDLSIEWRTSTSAEGYGELRAELRGIISERFDALLHEALARIESRADERLLEIAQSVEPAAEAA